MTKQVGDVGNHHILQTITETSHLGETGLYVSPGANGHFSTTAVSASRSTSTLVQGRDSTGASSSGGKSYLLKNASDGGPEPRSQSEKGFFDSGKTVSERRSSLPPISFPKVQRAEAAPQPKLSGSSMVHIVERMRVREKTLVGSDISGEMGGMGAFRRTGPILGSQIYFSSKTSRTEGRVASNAWENNVTEDGQKLVPHSERQASGSHAQSQNSIKGFSDRKPEVSQHKDRSNAARLDVKQQDLPQSFSDPQEVTNERLDEHLTSSTETDRGHKRDVEEDEVDFDSDDDEEEEKTTLRDPARPPGFCGVGKSPRSAVRLSRDTREVYERACAHLHVQPSRAFSKQCKHAVVELSDCKMGPGDVKPIAIALVRESHLCVLDLSHNNLGALGVSYIAEMLQENKSIVDLNLSATNPGREGIRALSETLRHNRSLSVLRLEENRIEHTDSQLLADIIKTSPSLRSLHLGHNRLGYYGGAAIAEAIAHNNSLGTLDLQWNHIRRDSAASLARALGTNKGLHTLILAWNGVGKEGCLALAHALPKNKALRELDVTCNRVDLLALSFLMKGVVGNKGLRTLKVGNNPLTTEGAKAMISAVTSASSLELCEIDISGVPVDQEFINMVKAAQETRVLRVKHEEVVTMATSNQKREHDPTNLSRFDPIMVLFEYMKLDNLRVIDMFQFMDTRKREKLSRSDVRDGLNTLKIPLTEYALDVIIEKLDLNKDGFVELDEMMKVHRETMRQIKLRTIKAKAKNREDESLNSLRQTLRDVIKKRTEENETRRDSISVAKTTAGRKSSVGVTGLMASLQMTQAKQSTSNAARPKKSLQAGIAE